MITINIIEISCNFPDKRHYLGIFSYQRHTTSLVLFIFKLSLVDIFS